MQYLITQAANGLIVQPVKRDTVVSNEFLPEGEPYVYKVGNGALDLKDALSRLEAHAELLFPKPDPIRAELERIRDGLPTLTEEAAEHLPA